MDQGIEIQIIFADPDMHEVRVRASYGGFSAVADVYTDLDACRGLAQVLRGFPTGKADVREFELGTFSADFAGGGIWGRCYVLDSAGHCAIEVRLQNKVPLQGEARFHIPIEPAAVDLFVKGLENVAAMGDRAQLESKE